MLPEEYLLQYYVPALSSYVSLTKNISECRLGLVYPTQVFSIRKEVNIE